MMEFNQPVGMPAIGSGMGGCCSGTVTSGFSGGYDAGTINTGAPGMSTAPGGIAPFNGSLSPANSLLPGNIVGEGT